MKALFLLGRVAFAVPAALPNSACRALMGERTLAGKRADHAY